MEPSQPCSLRRKSATAARRSELASVVVTGVPVGRRSWRRVLADGVDPLETLVCETVDGPAAATEVGGGRPARAALSAASLSARAFLSAWAL